MLFGTLHLLGSTEKSIIVETHRANRLTNSIALPPDLPATKRYALLRSKHPAWKNRKPTTGIYNCFGHLFASRRTAIREDSDVDKALGDDGYRKLAPEERVHAGDIVLYRSTPDNRLLHGGQVISTMQLAPGREPIPSILSKWNDTSGEDEHMIDDVPYPALGFTYVSEVWTDRP